MLLLCVCVCVFPFRHSHQRIRPAFGTQTMTPASYRDARLTQVLEEQNVLRALVFEQIERQKLQKDAKDRANQAEQRAEQDFMKSVRETQKVLYCKLSYVSKFLAIF